MGTQTNGRNEPHEGDCTGVRSDHLDRSVASDASDFLKRGYRDEFLGLSVHSYIRNLCDRSVVVDTYQHWTIFGQIVIILLIQIGGLGFVTFLTIFSMIAHRKIGLKERSLMSESVNAMQLGGIIKLTRKILYGTLIVEGTGAMILWIRFIPDFGVIRGLYYGIFHAISAFCNAGFDLMGYADPYISLCNYSGDWVVNLTIMSLIVIGGIGLLFGMM